MRKITKILLPIISSATVAASACSLASCSNEFTLSWDSNEGFFYKDLKVTKGTEYTIIINYSSAPMAERPTDVPQFFFQYMDDLAPELDSVRLFYSNEPAKLDETELSEGDNGFVVNRGAGYPTIQLTDEFKATHPSELNWNTKIKLIISFVDSSKSSIYFTAE